MLSWEQGCRWDLHSSGSFTFSCFEAHGKTPLPEELQRSRTSTILPFPNPNPKITWGETHRLWSIVILGLLGNRKLDNFLRRDLLEGKNPSHRSTLCIPRHSPDPWCNSLGLQESFWSTWPKKKGNFLPGWWVCSAFTMQSGKHKSGCNRGKRST